MKIDTSISLNSKKFLLLDVPYKFAFRHIVMAFETSISISLVERITHAFLGIINLIPILNFFTAYYEYNYANKNRVRVINIKGNSPYERGYNFGEQTKSDIQTIYPKILNMIYTKIDHDLLRSKKSDLENNLSKEILKELEGLADGANIHIDDVLTIHTFLDIFPGQFGCSVVASNNQTKVVATNHFSNNVQLDSDSFLREKILNDLPITSIIEKQHAMQVVNKPSTIQSMILNPNDGSILLTSGNNFVAKNYWHKYQVFPQKNVNSNNTITRNLDWPWTFLGPKTIITIYKTSNDVQVLNVTFPGYIGTLSAMNDKGLAIACSSAGNISKKGDPLSLLFKEVIENTSNCEEAKEYISSKNPASSMNLTISADDNIHKIEINSHTSSLDTILKLFRNLFSYIPFFN